VCVGVAVGVAVGVTVAVAVAVKLMHWPVAPLQDAPYTGTPLPRHTPPLGGPHAFSS
jgi:uncharacterized membrane-anchored protein